MAVVICEGIRGPIIEPRKTERASTAVQIMFIISTDTKGILILFVPYAKLAKNVSVDTAMTSKTASITEDNEINIF
jgi:hypothetical protein